MSKEEPEEESQFNELDLSDLEDDVNNGKIIAKMLQKPSKSRSKKQNIALLRAKAAKMQNAKGIINPPKKKTGTVPKHFSNEKMMIERGRAIRFLRQMNGLNMEEFALIAGVTRTYLSQIENGKRSARVAMLDYWMHLLGGKMMIIPVGS